MKRWIYITLAIGVGAQVYYFSVLPETVANHFGNGGIPNASMSNKVNLLVCSMVIIFNSAVFLSISHILKNVPVRYISFPKREYWLAPERRDRSIDAMSNWVSFMGLLTNVFLIAIFHMVYVANQVSPARFDENLFMGLLIIYLLITAIWLVLLYRKFNKVQAESGGSQNGG